MKYSVLGVLVILSTLNGAEIYLDGDNEYFTASIPVKWVVIQSGGKENQMMISVYDRTEGGYGKGVCHLYFDWDGLDPNHYITGPSMVANSIKWVNTNANTWIGIKMGIKYKASMQIADGVDVKNPMYYSFLNSIIVK